MLISANYLAKVHICELGEIDVVFISDAHKFLSENSCN